jgi:hypothetical protein
MYDAIMKKSAIYPPLSRKTLVNLAVCIVFGLVATGLPALLHDADHGPADASCKVCQLIHAASAFVAGAVIVLYVLQKDARRPALQPALHGVSLWHHQVAAPRAPPF